jgi:hypothetical protein
MNYHVYDKKCHVRKYPDMTKLNLLEQRLDSKRKFNSSVLITLTVLMFDL